MVSNNMAKPLVSKVEVTWAKRSMAPLSYIWRQLFENCVTPIRLFYRKLQNNNMAVLLKFSFNVDIDN